MVDLDGVPAPDPCACFAVGSESLLADLADEGRVALGVAESAHLLEQDGAPDVVVVAEPGPDVLLEVGQRIGNVGPGTNPGHPFAVQIRPDRLSVTAQMAGDGRDRPSPLSQSMSFHVFSSCEHGSGAPSGWLA
jgi:hypothetical protein